MLYVNRNVSWSQIARYPGIHVRWFDHQAGFVPFWLWQSRLGPRRFRRIRRLMRFALLIAAEGHERWDLLGVEFGRKKFSIAYPTPEHCIGYAWIEQSIRSATGKDAAEVSLSNAT